MPPGASQVPFDFPMDDDDEVDGILPRAPPVMPKRPPPPRPEPAMPKRPPPPLPAGIAPSMWAATERLRRFPSYAENFSESRTRDAAIQCVSLDFDLLTVDGLKHWCRRWGIPDGGRSSNLVQRLQAEIDRRNGMSIFSLPSGVESAGIAIPFVRGWTFIDVNGVIRNASP